MIANDLCRHGERKHLPPAARAFSGPASQHAAPGAGRSVLARDRWPSQDGNPYLVGLRRELGIMSTQSSPWETFAETLRANGRRMGGCATRAVDECDALFGELRDRLAAVASMKVAATALCAVLTPEQRRKAEQILPLCCLPAAPVI